MIAMEMFKVLQPGLLTTIQDMGRHGYQRYGVPQSGAMDEYALRLGNILVGNDESVGCFEITVFGFKLRVLRNTVIAITGTDLAATLNDHALPMWETVLVHSGDVISFPGLKNGCRAYLAVAGGIKVPELMRSVSTYTRAGIGGLKGRALRQGDRLSVFDSQPPASVRKIPPEYVPVYGDRIELKVLLGPQDVCFTKQGIYTFLDSEYRVSAQSDRMGYRLEGPLIQHKADADIVSNGIPLGAVQVPGDGMPIILLADRQTTGGYTQIATVISIDIPRIAQAKVGDKIMFRQVKESEAHKALEEYERKIQNIRQLF